MEVAQLYQFALLIVLVGMIVGIGVLLLDKLSQSSAITPAAQEAINAARDALADLAVSWLGLIVLIGALAVILVMVIRSFSGGSFSR